MASTNRLRDAGRGRLRAKVVYLAFIGSVPVRVFQTRAQADDFVKDQAIQYVMELPFEEAT